MKMSDVKVGMRLVATCEGMAAPVTVTEITGHGFKFSIDDLESWIPKLGMNLAKDGHEHCGYEGEALYEPAE